MSHHAIQDLPAISDKILHLLQTTNTSQLKFVEYHGFQKSRLPNSLLVNILQPLGFTAKDVQVEIVKVERDLKDEIHYHESSHAFICILGNKYHFPQPHKAFAFINSKWKMIEENEQWEIPPMTPHGFRVRQNGYACFLSIQTPPIMKADSDDYHKVSTSWNKSIILLNQYGLPKNLSDIHSVGLHKTKDLLGGSHSVVTYPPLTCLEQVKTSTVIDSIHTSPVHLYFHIPFCETRCTFCHYIVSLYRGESKSSNAENAAVEHYLSLLHREIAIYKKLFQKNNVQVASLYIGGGTPLMLSRKQLKKLIEKVQHSFSWLNSAPICVEASPLSILNNTGRDKLKMLQQMGVSRLSFGIQSFDNQVLRVAGRGYTSEIAIHACKLASQYFQNWNIDLIQDLSNGSKKEIELNIERIKALRPPHITWYNGRFSATRPQGIMLRKNAEAFSSEWETLLGRAFIWQELKKLGYKQIDGNRFVLKKQYEDPFKQSRTAINNTLIGLGVSAYSHTEKWFFRNTCDIQTYQHQLKNGQLAIAVGKEFTTEEKIAATYVIGLRKGDIIPNDVEKIGHQKKTQETFEHYNHLITELVKLNILEQKSGKLNLTFLGRLFEDEVLALFYSPSVKEILSSRQKILD
ncbi:MAG: radical SAM protein [Candidatus Abawacabacteria bacterium]|nr:radical SAM protein [Candidatus Abawacabacteria bacterium]